MLGRCLILLLIFLTRVRAPTPISPYFCDTKDKIDEILRPADNLKRFFIYKDQIYFVFKKRVIFGRQPVNDEHTKGNPSFVLFNFYEQPNNERELSEIQITHGYQVMGYYQNRSGFILEMYAQDGSSSRKNKVLPIGRQLAFSEVHAERTRTVRLDAVRTQFQDRHLMEVVEDAVIVKYVDIHDHQANYQIMGKFSYFSNYGQEGKERKNELMIIYSFDVGMHRGVQYHYGLYDFPDLKWFVVWVKEIGLENVARIDWFLMIIRENTFQLTFLHFPIFKLNKPIDPNDYVKRRLDLKLDYQEIFSCHKPFHSERELKGIYYDLKAKVFFVFVRRFYLKIEDDLVYQGFYIDPLRYRKAKSIHFESEQLYQSVGFEIINRKWVKAFQTSTLFIPSNHTFEVGVDENSDLKLRMIEHNQHLRQCLDQTLVVEQKHVYCFKDERYFFWYDFGNYDYDENGRNYPIESIFQDTAVKWPAGQRLLFIFNYQADRVVFMTRTHLFVFRYSSFRQEENERIAFVAHPDDDPDKPYYDNDNCLVVGTCTGPLTMRTTMFTVPTFDLTTEKTYKTPDEFSVKPSPKPIRLKDIKWYLIGILLLLLIVLIIVCTWYLTRKKRDFKGSLARRFPSAFRYAARVRRVFPSRRMGSIKSTTYPSSVSQFSTKPTTSVALPSDKQLEAIYPASKKGRKNAEKQHQAQNQEKSKSSKKTQEQSQSTTSSKKTKKPWSTS